MTKHCFLLSSTSACLFSVVMLPSNCYPTTYKCLFCGIKRINFKNGNQIKLYNINMEICLPVVFTEYCMEVEVKITTSWFYFHSKTSEFNIWSIHNNMSSNVYCQTMVIKSLRNGFQYTFLRRQACTECAHKHSVSLPTKTNTRGAQITAHTLGEGVWHHTPFRIQTITVSSCN